MYDKDESLEGDPAKVPYFEVVDKLLDNLDKMEHKMKHEKDKNTTEIKNLKRQIGYKENEIDTLKKQLAKHQEKSSNLVNILHI